MTRVHKARRKLFVSIVVEELVGQSVRAVARDVSEGLLSSVCLVVPVSATFTAVSVTR